MYPDYMCNRTVVRHIDNSDWPLLRIRYKGNDQTAHTITVDNNGDDSSTLLVTITEGTTDYKFAGQSTTGATTTSTIQALVDEINDIATGNWEAQRLGAADYPLTTNDFIDVSATSISREWTETLYVDVSELSAQIHQTRIGVPEYDTRGPVALGLINGQATFSTDAGIKVSQDRGKETDASHEVTIFDKNFGTSATSENIFDVSTSTKWPVYEGPLLVEVDGTDPTVVDVHIHFKAGH